MSKHLPECHRWFANMPEDWCPACEMFRACEQRVRQSAATLWDHTSEQMAAARVEGIRAGLTAAREAIAALDIGRDVRFSVDVRADALAAIDALREKP
jgi:hypothetical protein